MRSSGGMYSTVFITFNLFWFPSSKTSLIDQIGKLLFHEFLNLLDGLLETVFRDTRDMEIKRRAL